MLQTKQKETESDENVVHKGCTCDGECKQKPMRGTIWVCKDPGKDLAFCKKCWVQELEKGNVEEKDFITIYTADQLKKLVFSQIDKDKDGILSKEEFVAYFMDILGAPQGAIEGLFDGMDRNNDQVLDFEEFIVFWNMTKS